jgi:hypothetical protein
MAGELMDKKQRIEKIRAACKEIAAFDVSTDVELKTKSEGVDNMIMVNNKRIEAYQILKDTKPKSMERVELALDIFNENFKINNEKMRIFQFFCEDLYKRVEDLSKQVDHLADIVDKE